MPRRKTSRPDAPDYSGEDSAIWYDHRKKKDGVVRVIGDSVAGPVWVEFYGDGSFRTQSHPMIEPQEVAGAHRYAKALRLTAGSAARVRKQARSSHRIPHSSGKGIKFHSKDRTPGGNWRAHGSRSNVAFVVVFRSDGKFLRGPSYARTKAREFLESKGM